PGAVLYERDVPLLGLSPPGAVDARDRRRDVGRPQVDEERLGRGRLAHDRVEYLGHRVRGGVVDEGRHDGVLQEDALQDERLPALLAPSGQAAPLADVVRARLRRWLSPQPVHGPGPDGLVLVELAEGPCLLAPPRQPVLDPAGRGGLARADHPLDQDQPRRAHRPRLRRAADIRSPAPPGSFTLAGWGEPSARW